MAIVELTFTPQPAHVRTARLIATAVARRVGLAESLLDEIRLAVGEACSRAVEAHRRYCPADPVRLELSDDNGRFEVTVTDRASDGDGRDGGGSDGEIGDILPANVGLAVIAGLADDVEVATSGDGLRIRMSWPAVGTVPTKR